MDDNKILPNHVGIIMDGNGRWAKKRGLIRCLGHKKGAENLEKLLNYIYNLGIKYVSVYAFSTENFKRTQEEVDYLMDIFVEMFHKECNKIHEEDIKIVFSGRREPLRKDVLEAMDEITEKTKNNKKGIFNVCINYGGRQEITDGAKRLALDVKEGKINIDDVDDTVFYKYMYQDLPPIDFLIRTSGELRLSNYMLYQISYAEFYFPNIYFPDFNREEFEKAIDIYNSRDRRLGGDSKKSS